jgi:hypothetical protein
MWERSETYGHAFPRAFKPLLRERDLPWPNLYGSDDAIDKHEPDLDPRLIEVQQMLLNALLARPELAQAE